MGPDVAVPVVSESLGLRLVGRVDQAMGRRRERGVRPSLTLVLVLLAFAAGNANGAGKPHPTYPERQELPASDAERAAKCTLLRERTQRLGDSLSERGLLSRLDFVNVYQRSSQRFLEEQCGDVDGDGNALSHTALRSGKIKGSPAPSKHGGEHGDVSHAAGEDAIDAAPAMDASEHEPAVDAHSETERADG